MQGNQSKDYVSRYVKNILTLCLKVAIKTSLSHEFGEHWFDLLKSDDDEFDDGYKILFRKNSIDQCDFQALLKILLFREYYKNIILRYYGVKQNGVYGVNSAFDNLLKRLMIAYRNGIDSHLSSYYIESQMRGNDCRAVYGYDEAIHDMLKLAELFKDVIGENGMSYYMIIKNYIENYEADATLDYYSIPEFIENEGIRSTNAKVFEACNQLDIKTLADNGNVQFATNDYSRDADRIKDKLIINNAKQWISAILMLTGVCVASISLATAILITLFN